MKVTRQLFDDLIAAACIASYHHQTAIASNVLNYALALGKENGFELTRSQQSNIEYNFTA